MGGKPFAIPSLREYHVLVASEKHIDELVRSPEHQLSFHAAMNDVSANPIYWSIQPLKQSNLLTFYASSLSNSV